MSLGSRNFLKRINLNLLYLFFTILLVSISVGYIHLLGLSSFKDSYNPLLGNTTETFIRDETFAYAPPIWSINKGYLSGDNYIWEHRNKHSPFIGEIANLLPLVVILIFTGSINSTFILADFILPAILFLLIIYFLKRLNYSYFFSVCCASVIIVIPYLSTTFPYLILEDTKPWGVVDNPLIFSRTPIPQMPLFVLMGTILSLASFSSNNSSKLIYLLPVFAGISLYTSPFIYSTIIPTILLILLVSFKKLQFKKIFNLGLIFSFFFIPYALNLINYESILNETNFVERATFIKKFIFPLQIRYVFMAGLAVIITKRSPLSIILLIAVFFAGISADFHQVLLKRSLEADHWISRVMAPLATLSLFLIAYSLNKKFIPRWDKYIWVGLTIFLISLAVYVQFRWFNDHYFEFIRNEQKEVLISEIEKNTNKNDVLGSLDPTLNLEISGRTGRWIYMAPGDKTITSQEELFERVCDLAFFTGVQSYNNKVRGAVSHVLGLARSPQLIDYGVGYVRDCIKNHPGYSRYKLDYLILEGSSENYFLVKLNNINQ